MNRVQALVRLRFHDGVVAQFPVYQSYDGQSYDGQSYDGQSYDGQSYDGQSYDGQSYDGRLKTFYVQFIDELWISNSPTSIYDGPNSYAGSNPLLKDRLYKHPFRLEILGDWTQGWETIGLDNVEII